VKDTRRPARHEFAKGEARGGVDCSSGDEGHLFIASLSVAKIRRANVGSNEQGFVDAFNTEMLPLTRKWLTLERI
jgi:hypothetical protein